MPAFATENPPDVHVRAEYSLASAAAIIELRFSNNPRAAELYRIWLGSGAAWEAFGEWADSQPKPKPFRQELADVIHAEMCDSAADGGVCTKGYQRTESAHHDYYQLRAQNLIRELEPLIGIGNVMPVVRAVLEECD
jgi:hypothetical protein